MVAVPKPAELGFRWLSDAGQNQMCLRYHGRAAREAHPDERERTLSGSPGAAAALAGSWFSFDRTVLVLVLKPRPVYAWLRCRSLPNWASDGYRMRAKIRCACVIMGGPPGRHI